MCDVDFQVQMFHLSIFIYLFVTLKSFYKITTTEENSPSKSFYNISITEISRITDTFPLQSIIILIDPTNYNTFITGWRPIFTFQTSRNTATVTCLDITIWITYALSTIPLLVDLALDFLALVVDDCMVRLATDAYSDSIVIGVRRAGYWWSISACTVN